MYETPTLTPVKPYETPVLIDVKEISALDICITGGGTRDVQQVA
jgi:hypothetical protein